MKEKKANGVQLLLRAVVKDSDGKVISDTGKKPSRSFVIQFLEFLYFLFTSTGTTGNATSVAGTEAIIYKYNVDADDQFRVDATINWSGWGIVVGTGDTAEANTDYALETQLTEGVGAGNITHGESVVETTAVVGANVDLETKRSFINNTGSMITVKETGMYTKYYDFPSTIYHCIIRDVLTAPGVDVPDKCSITVYYTLRTTV